MILTILGLIVLSLPFSAITCFESRLKGFFLIFASSSIFGLLVAIITQALGLFTYNIVLIAWLTYSLCFLYLAIKKGRKFKAFKINWFTIFAFGIIFYFLLSLHYNYTGVVGTISGVKYVTQSSYQYPMYSDEWVAVSLIDYTIENKSLPLVNPLNKNTPFPNFLFGFHSFLALVMLLLNLSPLTHYVWLAILNGLFTCFCVYFLLRLNKVSSFASTLSAISIPFITNSGNLAGIWYLLPYNLSLSYLFVAMVGFTLGSRLILNLGLVLSIIIYPPMIVFVAPIILGIVIFNNKKIDLKLLISKKWMIGIVTTIILIILSILWMGGLNPINLFKLIVRERLNEGDVAFAIWNVLPVFVLPFVFIGVWDIYKRRINYILFPIIVGLIFWSVYMFLTFNLIITQTRIVSITSIFLIISAGFGVHWLCSHLRYKLFYGFKCPNTTGFKIGILFILIVFTLFYPHVSPWHKLVLVKVGVGDDIQKYTPSPPITRYLIEDDLNLFASIKDKRFISLPWKGLAIAVATGNYPLDSKSSTITNKILNYGDFANADCSQKLNYANKFKIDYAYTKAFSCPNFSEIGRSSENLVLYKMIK